VFTFFTSSRLSFFFTQGLNVETKNLQFSFIVHYNDFVTAEKTRITSDARAVFVTPKLRIRRMRAVGCNFAECMQLSISLSKAHILHEKCRICTFIYWLCAIDNHFLLIACIHQSKISTVTRKDCNCRIWAVAKRSKKIRWEIFFSRQLQVSRLFLNITYLTRNAF